MLTPTPFPVMTPVFHGPDITFWQFVPASLQIWNTAGSYVVVFQAFILLALVAAGIALVLGWLRRLSAQGESARDE